MKKWGLLLLPLILSAGCAHSYKYTKPASFYNIENSIIIDKPKDEVWAKLVSSLSETFFVINNIDKESGLINVSYSGTPENFVDCGEISSYIQNLAGERHYCFPAAKSYQEYEIWGDTLTPVKRKMELEGRVNILVESVNSEKTKVSVHTKYALTKTVSMLVTKYGGYSSYSTWETMSDSVSFTTMDKVGVFSSGGTECRCNGNLEKSILDLLAD